jgi:streptogramin lyase
MPSRKLARLTAIALSVVLWLVALPSAMAEPIATIAEYPLPPRACEIQLFPPCPAPFDIATGPDGALWFTKVTSKTIGRITTDGVITEYPLPSDTTYPESITSGSDGALWFTINNANIGLLTSRNELDTS